MVLFGELRLRQSHGLNAATYPVFLADTVLYASANAVCTVLGPSLSADAHITALAATPRPSAAIAYAVLGSNAVVVASYPRGEQLAVLSEQALPETTISHLAFSFDGRFLAVVYAACERHIAVWEWDQARLIGKGAVPTQRNCDFCSFNPFNNRQLCTVGDGLLNLWALDIVDKDANIWHTQGKVLHWTSPEDATTIFRLHPYMHCWSQEGQVFATTRDSSSIVVYDFITGEVELLLSAHQSAFAHMKNNMRAIGHARGHIVVAGQDGLVRWMEASNQFAVSKTHTCHIDTEFMCFSSTYRDILTATSHGTAALTHLASDELVIFVESEPGQYIGAAYTAFSDMPVTATNVGNLSLWSPDGVSKIHSFQSSSKWQTLCAHPLSSMIAVGASDGELLLLECTRENGFQSIKSFSLNSPVVRASFDATGVYLLVLTINQRIHLIEATEHLQHIGYLDDLTEIVDIAWFVNQNSDGMQQRLLFVLVSDLVRAQSFLHRYEVSDPVGLIELDHKLGEQLSGEMLKGAMLAAGTLLHGITICQPAGAGSPQVMYCLGDDHTVKSYVLPVNVSVDSATSIAAEQAFNAPGHDKQQGSVIVGPLFNWLLSYAADGVITYRSLPDIDKNLRIYAHDSLSGGVAGLAYSADGTCLVSAGRDSILRFWDWKYTEKGKEAVNACKVEAENRAATNKEAVQKLNNQIKFYLNASTSAITPSNQTTENSLQPETTSLLRSIHAIKREEELAEIERQLGDIVSNNEKMSGAAKIEPEIMLFDTEHSQMLLQEAEQRIEQTRQEIETANIKNRVISSRIKAECWDAMNVEGQSILSFTNDPVICKPTEVRNFPIRKRLPEVQPRVDKIKLMRASQILINRSVQDILKREVMNVDESSLQRILRIPNPPIRDMPMSLSELLYHPYELITNERKHLQIALLIECIEELKNNFNQSFQDMVKSKSAEVSKILERNDRIKSIMEELGIQESVYTPVLKDVEVPERVIEVRNDEITAPKYLSAKEQQKLTEKKRQDEERARLAQEDDSRERGLMVMMGGKLEEKTEKHEQEKLVRPECMDKAVNELSEEEKKLVKEYEKKLATKKEESEKYRKSLETELRKLQQSVQEICTTFDEQLRKFFKNRTQTDSAIFQQELRIIKLEQSILYNEDDDTKHTQILTQIEKIKREKIAVAELQPEIKKELDRQKEMYEQAVRRDRDIEKQFKKEFHIHEFYYDSLYKLFRRRDEGWTDHDTSEQDDEWAQYNPYSELESSLLASAKSQLELSVENDLPEGLSTDVWNNLVAFRNRKIDVEREVKVAHAKFVEIQSMMQSLIERSERMKLEAEHQDSKLNDFIEYRFLSMYNMDNLFELKQGQVEVPQAPVVTDYSGAILIHRSGVESLNERILSLGRQKVDALKEMKEYRKGIYMLEWENKVLDFQAEDLVIRTRDIQLLRVTKEMQEYLRSGNENMHGTEIAVLEKQAEYSKLTHQHKLEEVDRAYRGLRKKLTQKREENEHLDTQIKQLELSVAGRRQIQGGSAKQHKASHKPDKLFKDIAMRRRLGDLARSQTHDIAILKEEVQRLRLRTFPSFPPKQ